MTEFLRRLWRLLGVDADRPGRLIRASAPPAAPGGAATTGHAAAVRRMRCLSEPCADTRLAAQVLRGRPRRAPRSGGPGILR